MPVPTECSLCDWPATQSHSVPQAKIQSRREHMLLKTFLLQAQEDLRDMLFLYQKADACEAELDRNILALLRKYRISYAKKMNILRKPLLKSNVLIIFQIL